MPVDPRLGGVVYGLTPRDSQIAALQQQIADLQRQVADLRAAATIQARSGPPTGSARDGTPYLDVANRRLYVMATSWGYTPLT